MSKIDELAKVPDISFIDDLTVDDLQEQLVADYQTKYKELTGETLDLPAADPVRLVLYATALMGYQAMQYIDRAGKTDLLKYSYGSYLDNIAALKGLFRREATGAQTTLRYYVSAVRTTATSIPGGSRVTDEDGHIFSTDEYTEIPIGAEYVDVAATAAETGTACNGIAAGELNLFVDPLPYVKSVTNLIETSGGDEIESDDDLTYRVLMHPHSYSVAGPKEAYEYWAKTFRTDISDVMVYTPSATKVSVLFLLDGGVAPSDIICADLAEFLQDKAIRPLTDQVTVSAPSELSYDINFSYYINKSDSANASAIQTAVSTAVDEYKSWQRHIGRDINPSELIKRIVAAGAKRVELRYPIYNAVASTAVARCDSHTVTYGGLEDD